MSLFDLFAKLPTEKELKGSFGEWLAKYYTKVMTNSMILHDVLIDGAAGYTSQIDLLMIDTKGIYVTEVKTFDGKIYGDGKKKDWYYYLGGKKYTIYSPVMQNKKHIQYLKSFLNGFDNVPIFSIVLMICDDFKVSNLNDDLSNFDTAVCSSLPALSRVLDYFNKNKPNVIDELTKTQIYNYIQNNQHIGKEARDKHKQAVKTYKATIDENKKQKICPYCNIPLVLRTGKYGEFYGCSNFPKCRHILK